MGMFQLKIYSVVSRLTERIWNNNIVSPNGNCEAYAKYKYFNYIKL